MLARRSAPSSMAIYPSKNTPCSNTSFKSYRCQLYCIIVESILSQKACKHAFSTRLAAYTSMRRISPLDVAAGQPGLRPARMHNYTDRKKEPVPLVQVLFF